MPTETTLYYDPILDVHHRVPVASAITTAFYAAPQVPDDARQLFDAACSSVGFDREIQLPNAIDAAADMAALEPEADFSEPRVAGRATKARYRDKEGTEE